MTYVFNEFELDPRLFALRRGGTSVKIEPKVFNLLAYLIQHRDRVVSKRELLDNLWPDEFVSESALTYCVKAARQAIADDGVAQRAIKTLYRRGYHFVAPVELANGDEPASAAERRPAPSQGDRSLLVGRERELNELSAALEQAVAGHGRLALLVGEPGIGKTRTADELAVIAASHGAEVLIARCHEGDGAPAFWPWVQVIRGYIRERNAADLRVAMGGGAPDIAALVPDVRDRLGELPPPLPVGSEQARFRLFDSVTQFLKNAGRVKPLVLIVDDLHWADEPSLLLLQFLAREMRDAHLLLIGTYRDVELGRQHPLTRTLGELARVEISRRIPLHGLTAPEIRTFIAHTTGSDPPDALVSVLHKDTDGNPFFVTEIVRLLLRDGRMAHPEPAASWVLSIPETVREAIGRRLDCLPRPCRHLLSIAAVIGREFDLDLLVRSGALLAGPRKRVGRAPVLRLLDEAARARIIDALPPSPGRYRFAHALVRETVYEGVPSGERSRVHRAVGTALEHLFQANPDTRLDELAHHFFQGSPAGDTAKALAYACRAGDRARALLAYEDAAAEYERALHLFPLVLPDETRRCEVLLALGEARWRSGDTAGAKQAFQDAAALATQLGSIDHFARAALGFGGGFRGFDLGLVEPPLIALLEDARGRFGASETSLHTRVLARLAVALYHVPHSLDRRVALSQAAVDMAQRVGDVDAHLGALYSRHWAIWGPDNLDERLRAARDMVRLSESVGDREMALHAHRFHLIDLLELGDITGVEAELDACARLADELRQPYYQWYVATFRAMRALLSGRFRDAEGLAQHCLAVGQRAHSQNVLQIFGVQLFSMRREQGRLAELEASLRNLAEQYLSIPSWQCALVYLYSELDRRAETQHGFDRLAEHDFTDLPRDSFWLTGVTILADVCAYLGDPQRAAALYRLLLPYAARTALSGLGAACAGSVSHNLGRLAATMRQWDGAAHHFDDALDMNRTLGAPHLVAHTERDYAAALLQRAHPGDCRHAAQLLTHAMATYDELGMASFAEKASPLLSEAQRMQGSAIAPVRPD